MKALTQAAIRKSFINASKSQTAAVNFPADFDEIEWENIDQYGWRDHKMPQRAYLVTESAGKTTSILLRAPELVAAGRKAICALCEDLEDNDDVFMFVAPKAGAAGKNGNSVGTLIHSTFTCSRNVRAEVLPTPIHPDPELVKAERTRKLLERTEQFIQKVRG